MPDFHDTASGIIIVMLGIFLTSGRGLKGRFFAGPALGGILAEPCDHFLKGTSFCQQDSLLSKQ